MSAKLTDEVLEIKTGKMMKKSTIVFGILSILMMITIFLFSSQNAEDSTEQSLDVGMSIGKFTVKNFDELPKEEQISFAKKIDHFVRKTAHFTEYAFLGFLLSGFYMSLKKRKISKMMLTAWITGTLYAVTDEIHQLFVPGRSCQAFDVVIDSSGVLTGVLVMTAVVLIIDRIRRKRSKSKNNGISEGKVLA